MGAKNVVYSSDDNQEEEEEEDMRDVEDQVLTLFRRMISRGRQRKIPLEKIQTEISSVRSEQSNVKTNMLRVGKAEKVREKRTWVFVSGIQKMSIFCCHFHLSNINDCSLV